MEVHYKRIAVWGKFMGILMMLTLPLMVITGLAFMLLGEVHALIGVLMFLFYTVLGAGSAWVGKHLYDAGVHAKQWLLEPEEENEDAVIQKYADFLFTNVIFALVAIVGGIPVVVVISAVGVVSTGI